MVMADGWKRDKATFRKNVLDLVRTARVHGMA